MDNNRLINGLLKILSKAMAKKMYGSIELYFEAGKITQVTQRIINKVYHKSENGKDKHSSKFKTKHPAPNAI